MYLVFGCSPLKRRLFQRKHIPGEPLPIKSQRQKQAIAKDEIYIQDSVASQSLSKLLLEKAYAPLSRANDLVLLHNGQEKFEALFQDLERAEDHIHMVYYIYNEDNIGKRVQEVLVRKAQSGVKVRLILDGLGSRKLSRGFIQELEAAGIEFHWFLPLRFPKALVTLNYRNHRKLVVIDGRVGYLGGVNIGDEYLSRNPQYGYWRDTHLRLEGDCVHNIQETFLNDWYYLTKEIHREQRYFPSFKAEGDKLVQIIGGGPDSKYESIKELFFSILCTAQKEILVTTPYFIPDESMIMALKNAASRGVEVKIIIQGEPDQKLPFLVSSSYFNALIPSGVEIYRYQKGILHSKVLTIDKEISIVGSANFDIRSFQIDFELSAVIFNTDFGEELSRDQELDLKDCEKITAEDLQNRTKLKSWEIALARLLSPIL